MDVPVSARAALLQELLSGPGYGVDLIERVKDKSRGVIELKQGSVYPALRDLEESGFVKSTIGEQVAERGGRPRMYYQVTTEGRLQAATVRRALISLFKP